MVTEARGRVRVEDGRIDYEQVERLAGHGISLAEPLKVSPEGYRRVIVRDPDGYRLCLFDYNS